MSQFNKIDNHNLSEVKAAHPTDSSRLAVEMVCSAHYFNILLMYIFDPPKSVLCTLCISVFTTTNYRPVTFYDPINMGYWEMKEAVFHKTALL